MQSAGIHHERTGGNNGHRKRPRQRNAGHHPHRSYAPGCNRGTESITMYPIRKVGVPLEVMRPEWSSPTCGCHTASVIRQTSVGHCCRAAARKPHKPPRSHLPWHLYISHL